MMRTISHEALRALRGRFQAGVRVELDHMDDPYNTRLVPGCKGTVIAVDDMGTIHVNWDCGSSLGVVYGEDICHIIEE